MQNLYNSNEIVPCEFCNNMIPFDEYIEHTNICTGNNENDQYVDVQVHDMNDFSNFINAFANITDQFQFSNGVLPTNMNVHVNNSNYNDNNSNILHHFVNMLPLLINMDSLEDTENIDMVHNHILHKESCYSVVLSDNDDKKTCIICLEEDHESSSNMIFVKTECGHIYCKTCIDKWLSMNDRCPLCMHQFQDAVTTTPLEDI